MRKQVMSYACLFMVFASIAGVKIDGNTEIVFNQSDATAPEKTAFKEMKNYLGRIFKKSSTPLKKDGNKIIIGYHKENYKFFTEAKLKALGEEDFLIKNDTDGNVHIVGGRPRGTLYGVYHFLDELLGVHWYLPEFEYVPEYEKITFPDLNIYGKPAFAFRRRATPFDIYKKTYGTVDPAWCARNRLNDSGYIFHPKSKITLKDLAAYGLPVFYAPPSSCHTMPLLFPPKAVFKAHPEWIAMRNGKRELHNKNQHVGYCLSSRSLLVATIDKVKKIFRSYPESRYISISEGDGSGSCECPECAALVKKHGGKESALWLDFINQIADSIKDEFPDKLVGTLAYTHTAEPPENMTARDNVLIWLCAWSIWRGLPYDDPRNEKGVVFIEMLKKWRKICRNVHVWDYMTVYNNFFCPLPDLRRNIDCLQIFRKAGADGILEQGINILPFESGAPFKFWLYARAAWNPDGLNYEKLLKTFCSEYYGPEAGSYIYDFWIDMERTNLKKGFYKIGMGGWMRKAPHASRENMLKYDCWFRKALAAAKNPVHLEHVKMAYIPVQLILLCNWKEWSGQGDMPDTLENYYIALKTIAEKYKLEYNERHIPLLKILPSFYRMARLNIIVSASSLFGGSSPYAAFDGDENTNVSFGGFSGWLQVEFPQLRAINEIILVFSKNNLSVTYSITGSVDGRKWIDLISRKTISRQKHGERFLCRDRIRNKEKIKYLRINIHKMLNRYSKPSWTGIFEVYFNPKEKKNDSAK